jgi:hypothetical protein
VSFAGEARALPEGETLLASAPLSGHVLPPRAAAVVRLP